MALILVAGPTRGAGGRAVTRRVVDRVQRDGHAVTQDVEKADAVVALFDGTVEPEATALAASIHASGKPTLAILGPGTPPLADPVRRVFTQVSDADKPEDMDHALGKFYPLVQPFAGRLVRDLVPELVQESGHRLQFRSLESHERPRHLKRKLASEAKDLERADPGAEKEEIADVLETLEALIRERGYDREALRQVKAGKAKRRGTFEKCFIVDDTPVAPAASQEPRVSVEEVTAELPDEPMERSRQQAPRASEPRRADPLTQLPQGPPLDPQYDGPVWNADDPAPQEEEEDVYVERIKAPHEREKQPPRRLF